VFHELGGEEPFHLVTPTQMTMMVVHNREITYGGENRLATSRRERISLSCLGREPCRMEGFVVMDFFPYSFGVGTVEEVWLHVCMRTVVADRADPHRGLFTRWHGHVCMTTVEAFAVTRVWHWMDILPAFRTAHRQITSFLRSSKGSGPDT